MSTILLQELVQKSCQYVRSKWGRPVFEVQHAIADVLNLSRLDLFMQYDRPMEKTEVDRIRMVIVRLARGEPLAYIQEKAHFFGYTFYVNSSVLIPRPETELLVETVKQYVESCETIGTIVDVACGSGCIGISLKKLFPRWHVILCDISEKALAVAQQNAHFLDVDVEILQGDLLKPVYEKKIDVVVMNPPYISSSEMESLDPSVKNFEPKIALEAGPTGLELYKDFFRYLVKMNPTPPFCVAEIGSSQKDAVMELFSSYYTTNSKKDFSGLDRIVYGLFSPSHLKKNR